MSAFFVKGAVRAAIVVLAVTGALIPRLALEGAKEAYPWRVLATAADTSVAGAGAVGKEVQFSMAEFRAVRTRLHPQATWQHLIDRGLEGELVEHWARKECRVNFDADPDWRRGTICER